MDKERQIFVISALGYLGDTILTEPLCQNLRDNYKNCKIIVIADNKFKDLIKGFGSVDEIYGIDKKHNIKDIPEYFKFAKEFPYTNNVDYAIITHPHERSIIFSKFIGAKEIISLPVKNSLFNFLVNRKIKYKEEEIRNTYKADYNLKYIEHLCKTQNLPVKYVRNDLDYGAIKQKFNLPEHYIAVAPSSKIIIKDWDYDDIKNFFQNIKTETVVIGIKQTAEIAERLISDKINFIDLSNKTTVEELGAVIKMSDICISVDTGIFHFSYAQGVKTLGLFFNKEMTAEWVPPSHSSVLRESPRIKILIGEKHQSGGNISCFQNITADDVIKKIKEFQAEN